MNNAVGRALDEGLRLLDGGCPAEALEALSRGIGIAPENAFLHLYHGLAQVDIGESEAGLREIEEALAHEDGNPLLPVFYARALYDTGDFSGAEVQCQRVEAAQPGHTGAVLLRLLCQSHQQPSDGLARLMMAETPDNAALQGRVLHRAEQLLDDQPEVRPLWPHGRMPWDWPPGTEERPASLLPGDRRTWSRRLRSLQEKGLPEQAIPFAEELMRAESTDEQRGLVVGLYFETGRYTEAEVALRDQFADVPERNSVLGISLFELGYPDRAVETLQSAEPDSARAAHVLGRAYLAQGRTAEARRAFIRAASLDSSIVLARVARAYLHLRGTALQSPLPEPESPLAEPSSPEPIE